MRLIDADLLIERIYKNTKIGHYGEFMDGSEVAYTYLEIKNAIEEQPIAFDIENVVAELQKEIEWAENHGKSVDFRKGRLSGLRTAIRISRNGGAT